MPLTEALDIGRPLLVRSLPGTRFSYSNTGYALLWIVIERVTGQRYETWLDEQLLVPLGMHDSTFAFTTQIGPAADKRLAMGHFEAGLSHQAVAVRVSPAAQFTTTAADMLPFTRLIMGDGRLNGVTFITPEPGSYTQLDGYKRQHCCGAMRHLQAIHCAGTSMNCGKR